MERTLSKNESRIVLDLEWRGRRAVKLSEIRATLACSDTYARYLTHRLVKKGWLERLRPGVYRLIPAERGREGVADTNPLAPGALLADPYFFSFGTACTHHGLTDQVFAEIYIACRRHLKPETVRGTRYVFAYLTQEQFFGFTGIRVLGETVQMATRERALLDAVARPRFAGGLGEVSRIVLRAAKMLDWDVLLDLLRRWGESALVQRLGFLLDLHQIQVPPKKRRVLESLIHRGSKIHLGPRRKWGVSGRLSKPWNVVVNVPLEVLLEKRTADAGGKYGATQTAGIL